MLELVKSKNERKEEREELIALVSEKRRELEALKLEKEKFLEEMEQRRMLDMYGASDEGAISGEEESESSYDSNASIFGSFGRSSNSCSSYSESDEQSLGDPRSTMDFM